jgi:GntR family transcriptional regulator
LLLSIDENDNRPIYLQITGQIKEQVSRGILQPGTELPSVRDLAESLGINMHTVRSAYLKLRDDGIVKLRLGRRAVVSRRQFATGNTNRESNIEVRLSEIITDALLTGMSMEKLKELFEKQLERNK